MRAVVPLGLFLAAAYLPAAPAPKEKANPAGKLFVVNERGLAYLSASGQEQERLVGASNAALSPDGRWLACLQYEKDRGRSKLVIRPLGGKEAPVVVPDVSVAVGEGCLPVWSADGRQLLVGESRARVGRVENGFRVYDVATKKLTRLALSSGHWVTGWSRNGKRLLSTLRDGNTLRVCWVNADGEGEPEFLTREGEIAGNPLPSPDGKRILFTVRPGLNREARLYVMDLATKKRVALDEPGQTHGFCWNADGSRVAYTWQPTPKKGDEEAERVTRLITCDADGRNRKVVTTRRYKSVDPGLHVVIFFEVVAWR